MGPCDGIRLAWFEQALTYSLFVYTLTWWQDAGEWLTAAGFHASPAATGGVQWPVSLLSARALPLFAVVYFGSMAAVVFGFRRRAALLILWCCLIYVTSADRLSAFSMNKVYVVAYLVLLTAPVRDGGASLASAWPVRTLQATLVLTYFGAGLCKAVHGDGLQHADTLWYQLQLPYRTAAGAWMIRTLPKPAFAAMQYATIAFELLTPVLFGVRRFRRVGILFGLAMHALIALTMYRVGLFALQNLSFYVLFVDPERLRAARSRLRGALGGEA
jgi:hypothetical protein